MHTRATGSTRWLLIVATLALAACGVETTGDASEQDGEVATERDAVMGADGTTPDSSAEAAAEDTTRIADADAGDDTVDVTLDDAVDSSPVGTDAGPIDSGTADAGVATHTCPATLPRLNLRADFGAVGNGVADDTDALHRAAVALERAGGGELVIPPGTYRVGRQARGAMAGMPFYRPVDMFNVTGASCLQISGYGATLRLTHGMHYGCFDPMTGLGCDGPTTDQDFAAHVGRIIEISSSSNVLIEGLEVDGSNAWLVLGGQWGNVGRQGRATGLWIDRSTDVHVVDVHTHHHGLDGITVLYTHAAPPRRMPHVLERVNSEYNGRQAISWIGGWGLTAIDCQFNHTGRSVNHGGGYDDGMVLSSSPRAGLDIEPNGGTEERSREGRFTRCEFVDNAGPGLVSEAGDGGYSTFDDCTFWGTTSYSVWANQPGLRFENSRFYGTAVHGNDGSNNTDPTPHAALATVFDGCTFEDRPWTDGRVYRNAALYTLSGGAEAATWRNCTFTAHRVKSVIMGDPTNHEIFEGCTFEHGDTADMGQANFQGSLITSCHFTETAGVTRNSCVNVASVVVGVPASGAAPTRVDGPRVRWCGAGETGTIVPGTY